jgi:hypothetical protein
MLHLVGYILEYYYDARTYERYIHLNFVYTLLILEGMKQERIPI